MLFRLYRAVGLCLVLSLGTTAVRAAGSLPAQSSPSPSAQVIQALETMYVAAGSDDLALFRSVAAPDFFAFDGGKRFDGDALMELVRAAHAAGNVFVWRVTEPQVQFFGDAALITYVNRGSISDSSGSKSLTWL